MPPFVGAKTLKINFQLPIGYAKDDGDQIEYKIINNKSNTSILKDDSGATVSTKFSNFKQNGNNGSFTIAIPIVEQNEESVLKLQIRFANGASTHSEWSTVCYLKQILRIDLVINNAKNGMLLTSESPIFYGSCNLNGSTEIQEKYRFILLDIFSGEQHDSGWLNHNINEPDSYVFPKLLNDFTNYKLTYSIRTKNSYEASVYANFLTSFYIIENDLELSIQAKNNFDNGSILLNIASEQDFIGNLMLRRTSNKSNYTIWEDLSYLSVLNEKANIQFEDFYVESGTTYKYGIQKININGYRSYLVKSNTIKADFEDIFLVSNNCSIRIKYNPQVNNLKRNLLESKQDTIGNKYPFILKNGYSNYFSFTLGGLISYYAESNDNLRRETTKATNKNQYNEIIAPILSEHTLDLTNSNIYNERIYRNKIEEFLTNGQAKLFKSPTEGNMLIYLMQVSLTPKNELGRMLYSFTSTAYEIADSTMLSSLAELEIYNKGKYLLPSQMGTQLVPFSNIVSVAQKPNIYTQIKDALTIDYPNCTRDISYIKSIHLYAGPGNTVTVSINGSRIVVTENGYSLDNVLNITSLSVINTVGSNPTLEFSGIAVASFTDKDADNESPTTDLMSYVSVTNIGQFGNETEFTATSNGSDSYSLDLGEAIEQKYGTGPTATIQKFYSISYLKIQSNGNPFTILVNRETKITVVSDQATILNYPITSCIIQGTKAVATVDFIYNGYKYAT